MARCFDLGTNLEKKTDQRKIPRIFRVHTK